MTAIAKVSNKGKASNKTIGPQCVNRHEKIFRTLAIWISFNIYIVD